LSPDILHLGYVKEDSRSGFIDGEGLSTTLFIDYDWMTFGSSCMKLGH
jgi:hypothetical protein